MIRLIWFHTTHMFIPQFLRASSQRWYALFVRKTRSKPRKLEERVNGFMGRDKTGVYCPRRIPGWTPPTKSVYSPVSMFQSITKVAISVTTKTSRPTFCKENVGCIDSTEAKKSTGKRKVWGDCNVSESKNSRSTRRRPHNTFVDFLVLS